MKCKNRKIIKGYYREKCRAGIMTNMVSDDVDLKRFDFTPISHFVQSTLITNKSLGSRRWNWKFREKHFWKFQIEIRIPNFCYIQVIVFDLGYLPVAAVRTWQVRLHLSPSKMEFISISERYILVSFKMHISIWKNIHGIQFKHFLWFLHRIFSTVLMRC